MERRKEKHALRHDSKNRIKASPTSLECDNTRSCPAESRVMSFEEGISLWIRVAYLYGTVVSAVPCHAIRSGEVDG
jgi:hypothetical protein